jgi:hypothetical protein
MLPRGSGDCFGRVLAVNGPNEPNKTQKRAPRRRIPLISVQSRASGSTLACGRYVYDLAVTRR